MNVTPEVRHRPTAAVLPAALVLMAVLLLAAAGSARAAVPITGFFAGPVTPTGACSPTATVSETTAGSRSDFCIAFSTVGATPIPASGDDLKSMVIDTPTGFAGAPAGFPTCTDAQFDYPNDSPVTCPAASQVGSADTQSRLAVSPTNDLQLTGVTGRVFNMTRTSNEAARLGIVIDTPSGDNIKIRARVTLRPAPDVGLRSIIDDLPRTATLVGNTYPLAVDTFSLRFFGAKANHPTVPMADDFALIGSDCSTDQQTHIAATSYDGTPTQNDAAPYRLTDCANVPFTPSADISTSEKRPDVTTATTTTVKFAQPTGTRTSASVKKAVLTLPPGLSFSGQIASGPNSLPLCTAAQFAQTAAAASQCPAATAVGDASFTSPLLADPLTGKAFLGPQPAAGQLPDLYIEGQLGPAADAPRVKLVGHLTIDDQNRVVATLDDLPQVLVSEFSLTFRGGDHSALVTPPTCGDFAGALAATPYSAPGAPVNSAPSLKIDQDCDAVGSFSPTVAFSSAGATAGGSAAFTTTLTRPDRSQRITKTVVDLPAGVLATLKGVPECSQADAAASACPADTKVGSLSSLAGVGPAPFNALGSVYLTTRSDGAVAGISLSVPIKFGDVNLGTLAVPGRIEIRPADLGLRLVADVPERFQGIPLNIRSIAVSLDRAGFPLNPTNCGVLNTTSVLTGSGGATANVNAGFQVSGCAALKFAPTIDAAVTGATGKGGRPALSVRVESPAGGSALRQTYVTLPEGISVDLDQLPRACPLAEFTAGGCGNGAIIGKVSGTLSITDEPLSGDLYLLGAAPGKTLPGLGLAFKGRFAGRVTGTNQIDTKTGQLITAFDAIPDLPLTTLQIDINGGTGDPLIATDALCSASSVNFASRFVAQSGPTVNKTVSTQCGVPLGANLGGGTKASARLAGVRKGKPVVILAATAAPGKKIVRLDVTLPKGYALDAKRAKSRSGVALKNLSVKGSVSSKRVSSTKLRIALPKAGSTKARLLTRTGTIAIKSTSLRKSKTKVAVTVGVVYTDGSTGTVRLSLTPR